MYLNQIGEDTLVLCRECDYAANRQIARFAKPPADREDLRSCEKVATPDAKTVDEVAACLGTSAAKIAKVVMMIAGHEETGGTREEFVFAVVRGDMEVNETKLGNAMKADWLRPATDEEIYRVGAVPGYASPAGLEGVTVVVDEAVLTSPNLIIGANEEGFHLRNANVARDYMASVTADITAASDGAPCVNCGGPLHTSRGVEVGNIFKLGTRYSESVNAAFLDAIGQQQLVVMGAYGIGVGRLLACVAEHHHDERGLRWPITVAPFHAHLISIAGKSATVEEVATEAYAALTDAGVEVLYDDRDDRGGVKFMDADLIGVPLRITVSSNSLARGVVEVKWRDDASPSLVPISDAVTHIRAQTSALFAEAESRVVEVPLR